MKDSFILYQEQKEIFEVLTDEEAGKLIKAIFEYEESGQTSDLDKSLKIAFIPIKNILDKNKEKYEKVVERNKQNIQKRWEKENTKNTTGKFGKKENTKNTDNDYEYDNEYDYEHDNEKIKKKKKKSFDDVFSENCFSEEIERTLKDFIDMRKTIKKPMTTKALELLIKNLKKLTNSEQEQIAILNQSIEHGWQTVYPLKNNTSKSDFGTINDFKAMYEEARIRDEQAGNNKDNNFFSW